MAFSRNEESLIYTSYFMVLKRTDQYVELQSVSTGSCWSIFKNIFEAGKQIILYQKRRAKDSFYHEYCRCKTVQEAVRQIERYDDCLVDNQMRCDQADMDAERVMKVYKCCDSNYNPVSEIRLKGKWVEKIGFAPGVSYKVRYGEGKIEISLIQ